MIMPAKVDVKSCRFAKECVSFVLAWMYLPSWNCVCMISYCTAHIQVDTRIRLIRVLSSILLSDLVNTRV